MKTDNFLIQKTHSFFSSCTNCFIVYSFLILLSSVSLLLASNHHTQPLSKKEFVYRNTPKNAEISIKKSIFSTKQRKALESSWNAILPKDSIIFITIRNEDKQLLRIICFNEQILPVYGNFYQVGVALDTNGIIKDIALCGNYDMYGVATSSKRFLSQFINKGKESLNVESDIDGITGATMSVDLVTKSVNGVLGAFSIIFRD